MRLYTPVRGQLYFLQIGVFFSFGAVMLARAFSRFERPRLSIPLVAVATSAAAVLASAWWGPRPEYGRETSLYALDRSLLWLSGIALFLMLNVAARRHDLFRIFPWIVLVQTALLAFYGLAQHFGWERWIAPLLGLDRETILPYSEDVQKNALIATFGHPNFYGSFMGPAMFLILARAATPIRANRPQLHRLGEIGRLIALPTAFAILLSLYFAKSRAVWIGSALGFSVAGAIVLAAHRDRVKAAFRLTGVRFAAISFASLAVAAALLSSPASAARAAFDSAASIVTRSEFENRLYFWYIASGMRDPLRPIGIGARGFQREFWDDVDTHQQTPEGGLFRRNLMAIMGEEHSLDPGNVHNDYIETRTEFGPFALFAYLLLVGYLVWFYGLAALRSRESALPMALVLGGFVCMLFDQTLGFPLALPCSLALFWHFAALMNQTIERGAA